VRWGGDAPYDLAYHQAHHGIKQPRAGGGWAKTAASRSDPKRESEASPNDAAPAIV